MGDWRGMGEDGTETFWVWGEDGTVGGLGLSGV